LPLPDKPSDGDWQSIASNYKLRIRLLEEELAKEVREHEATKYALWRAEGMDKFMLANLESAWREKAKREQETADKAKALLKRVLDSAADGNCPWQEIKEFLSG